MDCFSYVFFELFSLVNWLLQLQYAFLIYHNLLQYDNSNRIWQLCSKIALMCFLLSHICYFNILTFMLIDILWKALGSHDTHIFSGCYVYLLMMMIFSLLLLWAQLVYHIFLWFSDSAVSIDSSIKKMNCLLSLSVWGGLTGPLLHNPLKGS